MAKCWKKSSHLVTLNRSGANADWSGALSSWPVCPSAPSLSSSYGQVLVSLQHYCYDSIICSPCLTIPKWLYWVTNGTQAPPRHQPWSSQVEGDEWSYLPNCQTNLVIVLLEMSPLFWYFINTTAYNWGSYHKPSSPVICRPPRYNMWLHQTNLFGNFRNF